ncbi:MAG: acyl carrier protein [Opitutales bacterium]
MKVEDLRKLVAESLMIQDSDFNRDTCFRDIPGYDSVNMLIMLVDLEEQVGLHIPADKAGQMKCLGDIIAEGQQQNIIDK